MYCRCNPEEKYEGPTIVCSWCETVIKQGSPDKGISHTICPDCFKKEMEKLRKERGLPPKRRNPDEDMRAAERRASSTGSEVDWDAYFAMLRRSGEIDNIVASVSQRAMSNRAVVEVSAEEYRFLCRYLNFCYRNGYLSMPNLRRIVYKLGTDDIRRALLNKPMVQYGEYAGTLPNEFRGYYWINLSLITWVTNEVSDFPAWIPVRVFKVGDPEFGKTKSGKTHSHRVFFCCMVCGEEMPAGRLSNHFEMVSHGAAPKSRKRPLRTVMEMLYRRKEQLWGARANEVHISYGGLLFVECVPDLLSPAQDYLQSLGLRLLRTEPARESSWHKPPPGANQYTFGH